MEEKKGSRKHASSAQKGDINKKQARENKVGRNKRSSRTV